MRRDIYLQNDAVGLSVISGCAVDEILEDQRRDDEQFVRRHHVLLLELAERQSLPVRMVVDEPLHEDESREWLSRVRWHLDVADGRVLIMGGFDPDVLAAWEEGSQEQSDIVDVAAVNVEIGLWDVDVYTFAGSPNGNAILMRDGAPIGTHFRRDHPGVAVPMWLAPLLDADNARDPEHEVDWFDVRESVQTGRLKIDTSSRGFVGVLVHIHQRPEGDDDVPGGVWFAADAGARAPARFPAGIRSKVEDPGLAALARTITGQS